jgi:imidazoleglycerol phosphate synthase glutamine amidotransferase subunit HisH
MEDTNDVDAAPVDAVVMPTWGQLTYAFAQLGPEDRMRVLIRAKICPKPILDLTWGMELTLLKHNQGKWPNVLDEIRWQRRKVRNRQNAKL